MCFFGNESDEDDEFGPVALAPLPNLRNRHAGGGCRPRSSAPPTKTTSVSPGEDISVTCSSIRSNGSLCRESEAGELPLGCWDGNWYVFSSFLIRGLQALERTLQHDV